jgi:predicted small integral membrane protein
MFNRFNGFTSQRVERLTKVLLSGAIALFFSLVVLNNITDYDTNFAYVHNILLMDSIYPSSTLTWRAIPDVRWHHIVYRMIITWETITAVLCWVGCVNLGLRLAAPAEQFNQAKSWVLTGLLCGNLQWLVGFFCIGGEWFAMWQSATWNGQPVAFQLFVMTTLILLLVRQPDLD